MFGLRKSSLLVWIASTTKLIAETHASGPSSFPPIILRIRKPDGSMGRIQIKDQEETTLSSVIATFSSEILDENVDADAKLGCKIENNDIEDTEQPISSFNLKNGSIINIIPPPKSEKQLEMEKKQREEEEAATKPTDRYTDFDPFPDIAKSSHSAAARRSRALSRLPNRRSMSYGDISDLRSYMHVIEPQPEGPVKRIYMCNTGAQRFKDNCTILPTKKQLKATKGKAKVKVQNRCAVLFGTVNKERVDQTPKARTSLSTPLYEMKMCDVVKVHAVWEPPQPKVNKDIYYPKHLQSGKDFKRAVEVANMLGMRVVGWIYSYTDNRQNDENNDSSEDSLPVLANDIINGAKGQISSMKKNGRDDGKKYVTLAIDANSGAAEAFQFSDVCVQMVAEGVLSIPDDDTYQRRFVETNEAIVIDNKETKELDSVLCLVNTAMLSHEGRFSGSENATKKAGGLTAKKKKTILQKLDGQDDGDLVAELCDFGVIMALDRSLSNDDIESLCKLVTKYSKGQKRGLEMNDNLKLVLKSALS